MNNKVFYAIVGILLLIFSAFAFVIFVPDKEDVDVTNSERQSSDSEGATVNDRPGVYVDYTEDAVINTPGTKLLFFHAPWCPQCREMEASIDKFGIPDGVTVFKVDYDSNQSLRQKYGVTIQTTFVRIDDSGDKIASYVAYEEPQFSSVERELLR